MSYRSLALAVLAVTALPANASIVVSATTFTYSQNFDGLASSGTSIPWTNDSTLAGWSLFRQPAPGTAITSYNADNGGDITGAFKSFGTTSSSDRALGGLGSGGTYFSSPGNGAIAGWITVAFTNATGSALAGFTLGFDGEQWRNGGNTTAQSMVLEYGFGSTFGAVSLWTPPAGAFSWTSPIATASVATVDGNNAGRVAGRGGSVTTSWAAGDTLWVRWVERNDLSNDHALAIDNLTFSVVSSDAPEPGSLLLLVAGLTPLGFDWRRAGRRGSSGPRVG